MKFTLTIECDNATRPWKNGPEEGWWSPSGNQQVPINIYDTSVTDPAPEWCSWGD